MKILGNTEIGGSATAPRTAVDTAIGTASGAINDYNKAQAALSGGGIVTWDGVHLSWTARFICIPVSQTSLSSGYVDIGLPATIPTGNVPDGVQRGSGSGIALNPWEALWAVHTPGGSNSAVAFFVTAYTTTFNAPSNWILVAAVNGDDGSVKLGNGETLKSSGTFSAAGARTFSSLSLTAALPTTSGGTGTTTATGTGGNVLSASPALTGAPTSPTPATGTNTTQIATTAFVQNAVSSSGAAFSFVAGIVF